MALSKPSKCPRPLLLIILWLWSKPHKMWHKGTGDRILQKGWTCKKEKADRKGQQILSERIQSTTATLGDWCIKLVDISKTLRVVSGDWSLGGKIYVLAIISRMWYKDEKKKFTCSLFNFEIALCMPRTVLLGVGKAIEMRVLVSALWDLYGLDEEMWREKQG